MMCFHPCLTIVYLARFRNRPAGMVPARLPEWSGIPVSRKKILTVTHPPDCPMAPEGTGSSSRRPPMRCCQILPCQPVVTDHNPFSVPLLFCIGEGHQSKNSPGMGNLISWFPSPPSGACAGLWHFPGSAGLLPIGFHNYCRKNNINVSSVSEMCIDTVVFV